MVRYHVLTGRVLTCRDRDVGLDGAAPTHDRLSAMAGSKMVGGLRRSTIEMKGGGDAAAISTRSIVVWLTPECRRNIR